MAGKKIGRLALRGVKGKWRTKAIIHTWLSATYCGFSVYLCTMCIHCECANWFELWTSCEINRMTLTCRFCLSMYHHHDLFCAVNLLRPIPRREREQSMSFCHLQTREISHAACRVRYISFLRSRWCSHWLFSLEAINMSSLFRNKKASLVRDSFYLADS